MVGVNLFNRNAWYHKEIVNSSARVRLATWRSSRLPHDPRHMPGEGHEPESPPFHDCGMHYVDVARWYAGSEYATWHAQGIRMWNHKVLVVGAVSRHFQKRHRLRYHAGICLQPPGNADRTNSTSMRLAPKAWGG